MGRHHADTPFDNIGSSHEFVCLLADAVAEALQEVELDISIASEEQALRRREALQLVHFNLTKLNSHMTSSGRILNDLRTLRRLLLDERHLQHTLHEPSTK